MNDFSVPMSEDDVIEYELGSCVHILRVPIGKTEREYLKIQGEAIKIAPFLDPAMDKIEEENKGKKWEKGEKHDLAMELALDMATRDFFKNIDSEKNRLKAAQLFNVIWKAWRKKGEVEERGLDGKQFTSEVMGKVVSWYQDQMSLTEDEAKK